MQLCTYRVVDIGLEGGKGYMQSEKAIFSPQRCREGPFLWLIYGSTFSHL